MISAAVSHSSSSNVQLVANLAYLTGALFAVYRLIDRANGRKIEEHVKPVMDALVGHMAEEEGGIKALVKGQKKIGKAFTAHAAADVTQFSEIRKTLSDIQNGVGNGPVP